MSGIRFELNREGVRELLKSEEMQAVLQSYAESAVGRLGEGYATDVHVGKNRANVSVYAETPQARSENYKTNSILKAVNGG